MAIADFKINTSVNADRGYDATTSETITLQLENAPTIDVRKVVFSIEAQSDSAPSITLSPSNGQPTTPGGTVTFSTPASGFHSYKIQCQVNDGQSTNARGATVTNAAYTTSRIIAIRGSTTSLRKTVPGERDEYASDGWSPALNELAEAIENGGVGGIATNEPILTNGAASSMSNEVNIQSIGTTLGFASTSTIPCSFQRTDSATNTAVDARKLVALSSSSAANGFGVSELYQAEGAGGTAVDVGRLAFTFTDITGSSEDTKFAVQVRTGGSSLATAFELTGTSAKLAAIADGTAGYVAIDTAGNLSRGAGGSGAPADAQYLVLTANGTLSAETAIDAIGTTVPFISTSTIPASFSRQDAATNTVVDVEKTIALSAGTVATSFGIGHLYQAEQAGGSQVDIGRTAFRWTTATTLAEASEYLIQLRNAGDGLATKLTLSSDGRLTVADATLSSLGTGYVYATSGVLSVGATQPAPSDAAFLTNGAVSGLSNEVDVTAIGTTQPFASATTTPIAIRRDDSTTNSVIEVLSLRRTTSSTAAAGIGGEVLFETEDAAGNIDSSAALTWRLTTATDSGEVSEVGLWTKTGGGSLTKHAYLTGAGAWTATSVDTASVTASGGTLTVSAGTTTNLATSSSTNNIGVGGATNTITGDTTRVTTNPSSTNTAPDMFVLTRTTSGTAAAGIGLSQKYEIENASGTTKDAGFFKVTLATATAGNETTKFAFWMMGAGGSASERFYWAYDGNFFGDYTTFSNVFASLTTSGFRFNDAGNRGGLDQDGSNHLRLKSYNSKSIVFYTGADASGVGGVLRLTIDSAGLATFAGAIAGPRMYADPSTPSSASNAVTFNLTTSQNVHHTTTENTTVTITGGTSGQHGTIIISQGATGRTVTMPTNGIGVEYDNTIAALTTTGIIDTTALTRTVLAYYVLPNGKACIFSRSVVTIP